MQENKIDGKEVSLIARRYFEEVLNTKYLYFETIKVYKLSSFAWSLVVEIGPFYSTEKRRYKLEISSEGDVNNVEQISTTNN